MPARYPDRELPADQDRNLRRGRAARSIEPLTPPPAFGSQQYGGMTAAPQRRGGAPLGDRRTAGPPAQGPSHRNTNIPPRYVPGAAPSYGPAQRPADGMQRPQRGAGPYATHEGGRPATGGKARRTDPTLYEWDRLSPEQQQAVLSAIGSAGQTRAGISRRVVVVGLLVVALVAIVVIAAILWH